MSNKEGGGTFTARDLELLAAAMKSMKSEPVVDYSKFAVNGGFKNANSAKGSWHALKKKLDKVTEIESGAQSNGTLPADTPNKVASSSKKRKITEDDDEVTFAAIPETPVGKKGKARKATSNKAVKKSDTPQPNVEAGHDDDVPVKDEDEAGSIKTEVGEDF